MNRLKLVIIALALFQGVWFTYDGGRALIFGDYMTRASGPYAGQLGLWSQVVSAVGFAPRGTFIKSLLLFLGIASLAAVVFFVFRPAFGWWFVFVCALGSLWYLPMGTLSSLIQIGLLLTPQIQKTTK